MFGDGLWGQPVNSVTSLAFIVVGAVILAANRPYGAIRVNAAERRRRQRLVYGALAVATGAGSFIFHGPAPSWAEPAHDLPLVAILAFVAADAVSDLTGRRLSAAWWVLPSLLIVAAAELAGTGRSAIQGVAGVIAVAASLLRYRARPHARRTIAMSLAILGTGALIGTLSRSGVILCDPGSVLQGHGVWHVLAAAAIWRLTPVVGRIDADASLGSVGGLERDLRGTDDSRADGAP